MWTVSDAKSRLSELMRRARSGEPQVIGVEERCVLISERDYVAAFGALADHDGKFLLSLSGSVGAEIALPPRSEDRDVAFPPLD